MSRDAYVRALLALYCDHPHTAARRPSKADRQLAAQLFEQGVPLVTVEAAFGLATARRTDRPSGHQPLLPIRSLAYFLPVVEELHLTPQEPAYLLYLRHLCSPRRSDDQIPADLDER
jgi:hypothetical protein